MKVLKTVLSERSGTHRDFFGIENPRWATSDAKLVMLLRHTRPNSTRYQIGTVAWSWSRRQNRSNISWVHRAAPFDACSTMRSPQAVLKSK